MTSRHLYFKLLWEDVKRKSWAAALEGLSLFFAMPVALAMVLSNITVERFGEQLTQMERQRAAISMLKFGDSYPIVMLILAVAAVIIGISVFSYLHSRRQVDFYHSLPVKRETQFAVHASAGILITAAVYLLTLAMALVVAVVGGGFSMGLLWAAAKGYLCHMLYYILMYTVTVLAVMLTGTRIASVLGTVVFLGYFPALGGLVYAFCSMFLKTYYGRIPSIWTTVLPRISPADAMIQGISEGVTPVRAAGALAAILLIGGLTLFLYKKRPSEAAGKTMTFAAAGHVIKVLMVIPFGLAGSLFFSAMNGGLGWSVFGTVVGVVVSHCVIEVIYHADFKKLFCHEKTMAACMAAALAVVLGFRFDVLKYDSFLPSAEQIVSASVDFDTDGWVTWEANPLYYDRGAPRVLQGDAAGIEALLSIAEEGIQQTREREQGIWNYQESHYVVVRYTLKGGKKVYRAYQMALEPVLDAADEIYTEAGYKQALYPGLTLPEEEAVSNMVYMDYAENVRKPAGTQEELAAVYQAYREEITAMSLSRMKTEAPIGKLLLISDENAQILKVRETREERQSANWQPDYTRYWYEGFFYPIYPSFTRTIQALSDCGIQAGDWMDPENIESIQVEYNQQVEREVHVNADGSVYYTQTSYGDPIVFNYKEPEEIRQLMEGFGAYNGQNQMQEMENGYSVTITMDSDKGEIQRIVTGGFLKGKVPELVAADAEAADAQAADTQTGNVGAAEEFAADAVATENK